MATPKTKPSSSLRQYPSNSSASQVRVVLRVRPFLPSEIASNDKHLMPCFTVLESELASEVTVHLKDQWTSRNECYKLDSFFEQGDSIAQIFQREVSSVIPGIFQGLNATVFAYGATGSGKTYTMQGTEKELGLIPLAMSNILSICESTQSSVEVSYYEVYMDRCYDLLEPKAKEILALDDKDGQVQLKGLSSIQVRSMDEFCQVFSTGIQRRKVAHTGLNDVSSRSHGVLAIAVSNGIGKGKLNLIDLAGNEDNRRTCNEGIRLQESAKINQSLFALSNVIYALNNNEPRIPYRESKLTRILQDSLGGKSRALMIACLNPTSYQEAIHTVSLAARSRQIVNYVGSANKRDTPREKVDMEAKLRAWLESKGKNKSVQRVNGPCSSVVGKTPTSVTSLKKPGSVWSSSKAKNVDRVVSNTTGRKLFDSEAPISATLERSRLREEEMVQIQQDNIINAEITCSLRDENCQGPLGRLNFNDQSEPSECAYSYNDECYGGQCDEFQNSLSACMKEYSEKYTTPNGGVQTEIAEKQIKNMEEKITADAGSFRQLDIPDTPSNKENMQSCLRSPLINEKLRELHDSLQRVLSPVSNNGTPIKHLPSKDQICVIFLDPHTPNAQSALTNEKDEIPMTDDTPLDKFNSSSCNLKDSLVQEYLSFLNVASKEELLQLKGIGQKRADYILQLREDTPKPLKSLIDLEKIGLSSKQVHDMFRRVARGIFT